MSFEDSVKCGTTEWGIFCCEKIGGMVGNIGRSVGMRSTITLLCYDEKLSFSRHMFICLCS